jgi:hypothetical protein
MSYLNARCLLACGVLVLAADVAAQDRGAVYVNAGGSFPHQAAPGGGTKPPFAAPGGNTIGWLVGGGVFLSPKMSIEGELSSTGVMKSTQSGRDFVEVASRRDRFVSLGVKGHVPSRTGVRVEPVGGIVLTLPGDASMDTSQYRPTPSGPQLVSSTIGYADLARHLGFMFGADVRIGGRHLALVPGVRIAYTNVTHGTSYVRGFSGDLINLGDRDMSSIFDGGYPKWTQRATLSLNMDF